MERMVASKAASSTRPELCTKPLVYDWQLSDAMQAIKRKAKTKHRSMRQTPFRFVIRILLLSASSSMRV
jgi:hypothetical protein